MNPPPQWGDVWIWWAVLLKFQRLLRAIRMKERPPQGRMERLTACLEACITSSSVAEGRPYDILWKMVSLKRICIATHFCKHPTSKNSIITWKQDHNGLSSSDEDGIPCLVEQLPRCYEEISAKQSKILSWLVGAQSTPLPAEWNASCTQNRANTLRTFTHKHGQKIYVSVSVYFLLTHSHQRLSTKLVRTCDKERKSWPST